MAARFPLQVLFDTGTRTGPCPGFLDDLHLIVVVEDVGGVIVSVAGAIDRLGWSPADLEGRRTVDLLDRSDRSAWVAAAAGPTAGALFVRALDAGGSFVGMSARHRPWVDSSGARLGLVTTLVEARPDRELELQLYAAQRTEVVGLFAGGIAHDFNNLLSVILSYTSMARAGLAADSMPARDLDEVLDASRRAAGLVHQLLSFVRGRDESVARRPVDLGALVEGLVGMLRRIVGDHIRVQVETRAGLEVLADDAQLEQIVMNLAVNARDALVRGGTLTVRTTQATHAGEEWAVLVVEDTGTGMTDGTMARIFDPFFSTKGRSGTGLGLTVTRSIVHQLGGSIEAASILGSGSRFTVWLPLHRSAPPAPAQSSSAHQLLVVEDEPALREFVAQVLRGAGHQVLCAGSAAEAVNLAKGVGVGIRVALLDRVLPDPSGPRLEAELRALCPGLVIVWTTGFTAGLDGLPGAVVLQKPFGRERLLEVVEAALADRRDLPVG